MGGIGNQMFQYAAARRLAHVHNVPLKLDLNWFDDCKADSPRPYELHVYAITALFASKEEIRGLTMSDASRWRSLFMRFAGPANPYRWRAYVRERHFHFDPDILKLQDDVYLDGYWQSEKYFKDIEDIIRQEFTVKGEPDARNRQTADMIKGSEAVSIHVRRGDYVTNPSTGKYHGICSLDYYRKAMAMIASRVKDSQFIAFSDDPAWVKDNLTSVYPLTCIDFNGPDRANMDMHLMSLCKHHIIANSSFSWWGAWLCTNPDKIIIAPKKWFNNQDINTTDLMPEKWIKI
jgi:hypothetical protein